MDSGFLSSSAEQYPAYKSFEDRINILYGISSSNTDIVVYQPKHVAQHQVATLIIALRNMCLYRKREFFGDNYYLLFA